MNNSDSNVNLCYISKDYFDSSSFVDWLNSVINMTRLNIFILNKLEFKKESLENKNNIEKINIIIFQIKSEMNLVSFELNSLKINKNLDIFNFEKILFSNIFEIDDLLLRINFLTSNNTISFCMFSNFNFSQKSLRKIIEIKKQKILNFSNSEIISFFIKALIKNSKKEYLNLLKKLENQKEEVLIEIRILISYFLEYFWDYEEEEEIIKNKRIKFKESFFPIEKKIYYSEKNKDYLIVINSFFYYNFKISLLILFLLLVILILLLKIFC